MQEQLYTYRIVEVNRIIDGDTFVCTVDLGFHLYKIVHVRLKDFDALEITHGKRCRHQSKIFSLTESQVIQIGKRLKEYLRDILLADNNELILKSMKLDSFGRVLGKVYKSRICIASLLEKAKQTFILEYGGQYCYSLD